VWLAITDVRERLVNPAKQAVLAKYHLTDAALIARGMEAEVYAYGADAVLKLYPPSTSLAALEQLHAFYAALDRSCLSYAVPRIDLLADEGAYCVTIEPRLAGHPFEALLDTRLLHHADALMTTYVEAVLEVARIAMPPATSRYKVVDPDQLSTRAAGDWHAFLRRWLDRQLPTLAPYLTRDVDDFAAKCAQHDALLAQPYRGPYQLIHGDIFPGNLLAASDGRIQALLDFGRFSMYGDAVWDAATAWVFFDMYEQRRANLRARVLPHFLERLADAVRGRLYRYVLVYSLLSAHTYAADCSDGHYAWCVANLNTAPYWERIE